MPRFLINEVFNQTSGGGFGSLVVGWLDATCSKKVTDFCCREKNDFSGNFFMPVAKGSKESIGWNLSQLILS